MAETGDVREVLSKPKLYPSLPERPAPGGKASDTFRQIRPVPGEICRKARSNGLSAEAAACRKNVRLPYASWLLSREKELPNQRRISASVGALDQGLENEELGRFCWPTGHRRSLPESKGKGLSA